ncbi:MAG: cell division protein FtsL [Candidatus Aminicenantes bacterium]|nr:cell division protein FtsL [Candidatus Aminicenantes bacterium]
MMKKKTSNRMWLLMTVIAFILVFFYLSLNLKSIDSGYEMQELFEKEQDLKEEITKLQAEKASLLSLDRVEKVVTAELGYQYPQPHQLIKVFAEPANAEQANER